MLIYLPWARPSSQGKPVASAGPKLKGSEQRQPVHAVAGAMLAVRSHACDQIKILAPAITELLHAHNMSRHLSRHTAACAEACRASYVALPNTHLNSATRRLGKSWNHCGPGTWRTFFAESDAPLGSSHSHVSEAAARMAVHRLPSCTKTT